MRSALLLVLLFVIAASAVPQNVVRGEGEGEGEGPLNYFFDLFDERTLLFFFDFDDYDINVPDRPETENLGADKYWEIDPVSTYWTNSRLGNYGTWYYFTNQGVLYTNFDSGSPASVLLPAATVIAGAVMLLL
jgi:hypothetical protein